MQPHEKACDCQNCYHKRGRTSRSLGCRTASSGFQAEEKEPWASDNVTAGPDAISGQEVGERAIVVARLSIGSPWSRSPSAIPVGNGSMMLPIVRVQSQVGRHRWLMSLPRYSKDAPSDYERQDHRHHRQRKGGEHAGVPRRERGGAGDDKPYLVTVRERADGIYGHPALEAGPTDQHVYCACAHVETFQDEEPGPQEGANCEPEELWSSTPSSSPLRPGSRPAWALSHLDRLLRARPHRSPKAAGAHSGP